MDFPPAGVVIGLLAIAATIWLAWLLVSGAMMPVWRIGSLSGVAALFLVGIFVGLSIGDSRFATTSLAFGFFLYMAGVVAIAAAVAMVWMRRPKTQMQGS